MRSVRSDALIRRFITVLHLEDGDLDYSKQEVAEQSHGGGVAGRVDVAEAASVTPTRRADGTVQHCPRCGSGGGNLRSNE